MKKTMFITSVIMVVVMAIALTTSSLAWFSAQGSTYVETTTLTINAESNVSDGLLISNDAASGFSTDAVDLNGGEEVTGMLPVVPLGTSVAAALGASSFIGNTVKTEDDTLLYSGTAYTTGFFSESVYVANTSTHDVHVQAEITFTENHGAPLYVGVVTRATSSDAWELIAIAKSNGGSLTTVNLGSDADAFADDQEVDLSYVLTAHGKISTTSFTLEAKDANALKGGSAEFKIVAWYTDTLYNNNSGAYDATTNSTGTTDAFYVTFSIPAGDQMGA